MSGRKGVRPAVGAAIAALLGAMIPAAAAGTAHAVTQITCVGQDTGNYHPGLTLTPQDDVSLTTSDTYTNCPSQGLSSSTAISATLNGASCLNLGLLQPYTEIDRWKDGDGHDNGTSTITWTVSVPTRTPDAVIVVLKGTVTAGRYQGFIATKTVTDLVNATTLIACETTGLTSLSGAATLELTSL